jgi:uncharacterized protein (DUF433 family)
MHAQVAVFVQVYVMSSIPSDAKTQERAIVCTPGICGGNARIPGTRIPVWGLEQARRSGWSDRRLIEAYPWLSQADLELAWAYVATHSEEIERQIQVKGS